MGPAIPGCEVRLADDGEVHLPGRQRVPGYLDDPEKTAEALDDDGWLHTGDIGEIDDDGYLRIVDRKKELIITAGGKNISPANLEAALKMIPLVGPGLRDRRPAARSSAALVVLDPEVAPAWAEPHGIGDRTLAELAERPRRRRRGRSGASTRSMAGVQPAPSRSRGSRVLGEEWLPDSDVLTPTSKLKRRGIVARYADEIEALYAPLRRPGLVHRRKSARAHERTSGRTARPSGRQPSRRR